MNGVVGVGRRSRSCGTVRALEDVSFSVAEGEVFGFLGPNGAGKTTMIRVLLGLLRPDRGAARIGGHDCWHDHSRAAPLFGAPLEQPGLSSFLSGHSTPPQCAP